MAPFRRVAQAAKQIVKARKPQSCALFSFQILRFCSRWPAFCSCVPVLCSRWPAFCLLCPGTLLAVASHSTSAAQNPASHSTFYLPKGSLSPSRFCFSAPNVQYYVHKAQSYHIQANIPSNSRTKTPILCSGRRGLASGIVKVAFLQITAHALKMQIPHNQIINFYQRAR